MTDENKKEILYNLNNKYVNQTFTDILKMHNSNYVAGYCKCLDSYGIIHGKFYISLSNALNKGINCPKCGKESKLCKQEEIIKRCKQSKYGKLYNYDKFIYHGMHKLSTFICPKHGEFQARVLNIINNHSCMECKKEVLSHKNSKTNEEYIKQCKIRHGDKYDYSITKYKNIRLKVDIICPLHGKFSQYPNDHLVKGCGCPKCHLSHLENEINILLNKNNIDFEYQKKFEWLDTLSLDFYLPQYNIGIECQGVQHFKPNHFFEKLDVIKERDDRKNKLCEEHGIKLLFYSNLDIKYPYKVFENKEELLHEIIK